MPRYAEQVVVQMPGNNLKKGGGGGGVTALRIESYVTCEDEDRTVLREGTKFLHNRDVTGYCT